MCTKLISIVLLFALFSSTTSGQIIKTTSFKTEKQILSWMKQQFGHEPYKHERIEVHGKQVFILFMDMASGVVRVAIHMFIFEDDRWRLLLTRHTGTADVQVQVSEEQKSIVLRSKSGTVILAQPFESLTLR